MTDGNTRSIYLIFAKSVHFAVVLIAASLLRKNRVALTAKQIAPLFPCLVVSIYTCIVFFRVFPYFVDGFPIMLILVLVGLLYINGIIVLNTQSIKNSIVENEEQKQANRQYEMQLQYYDAIIEFREEARALWHDYKKQVTALEALVGSGDIQSAKNEYSNICHAIGEFGDIVDVENVTISAILQDNISKAKSNNISVTLDAHVSPDLRISAVDLSAIIGNTFDNAIEECLMLTEISQVIDVSIIQKKHMLFYEISNPCMPIPRKKEGKIRGYGLKNVLRCVDKHSGSMEFGMTDNRYIVSIRLNTDFHCALE
jgi:sensor histidine kinase regulating citrate/malate metabolism